MQFQNANRYRTAHTYQGGTVFTVRPFKARREGHSRPAVPRVSPKVVKAFENPQVT